MNFLFHIERFLDRLVYFKLNKQNLNNISNSFVLIILIILCIFRLPILAITSSNKLTPILNILPLFFLFVCIITKHDKKILKLRFLELLRFRVYQFSLFSIFYYFLIITHKIYTSNLREALIDLRGLSSTSIFLLFPLLIDLNFSKTQLERILSKIFPPILLTAFILTVSEFTLLKLNILKIETIYFWLKNEQLFTVLRINTFMGQGAVSGIISLMGCLYLLNVELDSIFLAKKIKVNSIILIILSMITILLCDSLTLLLAMLFSLSLMIVSYYVQHKQIIPNSKRTRKLITTTLISSVFLLIFLFVVSGLGERFYAYFFRKQIVPVLYIYLPRFSSCNIASLIFGLSNFEIASPTCTSGEMHGFFAMFKFGILSQLGWFVFFFYPLTGLFKLKFKDFLKIRDQLPLIGVLVTFIHYSGAELWGNNYIFGLLMVVVIKTTRESLNTNVS